MKNYIIVSGFFAISGMFLLITTIDLLGKNISGKTFFSGALVILNLLMGFWWLIDGGL